MESLKVENSILTRGRILPPTKKKPLQAHPERAFSVAPQWVEGEVPTQRIDLSIPSQYSF